MFDPKTLLDRGRAFVRTRQPEEACDMFAQAVAEARFLHHPGVLTEALMALGGTEGSLRHPATAVDCYREAAVVAEHSDQPVHQAEALMEIAEILLQQEKRDEAAGVCDQLLAVAQKAADDAPLPRARALCMLARIQENIASPEELVLMWQAAASLLESAGKLERAAECKAQLAFLLGQ